MSVITDNHGGMPANTDTFSEEIVLAVRAEMGRKGKKIHELVTALGLSRPTVSSRLNGHTPFTAEELDKVARFLGISAYDLIASAELGSGFRQRSTENEAAAFETPQDPWAQPARSRAKRGSR